MLEIKSPHNQEKMGLTLLIITCIVIIDLPMTVQTFVQSQTHHKLRTKTGIYTQVDEFVWKTDSKTPIY